MVAAVKTRPSDIVAVKEHPDCDASQKLDILQKIGHERFITWLDIFEHETTCYIVSEFVLVSLTEVVACPAYPTEQQLVAILAQVSGKLAFCPQFCANEARFCKALITWPRLAYSMGH